MPFWSARGGTVADWVSRGFDRRLLRRAQASLEPVLRDGETVVAFDPAVVAPSGSDPVVPDGLLVTLYLTDLALYVLDDDGAELRIARTEFVATENTGSERIELELTGGRCFAATPAPAPSRIGRVLTPEDEP